MSSHDAKSQIEAFPDAASLARSFDIFNVPDEYYDSPSRWFKALRDHDPIHRNSDGSVLLTRFDDVMRAWRHPTGLVDKSEMFGRKFGQGPLFEHHTTAMLFRDPPDHDRLRAIVAPFLSATGIKHLQAFSEETVASLLDEIAERKEVDFVADYARRLPLAVICKMFGVPQSDGIRLQGWGKEIMFPLNPKVSDDAIQAGHRAAQAFKEYLLPYLEQARADAHLDPNASVINSMVAAERAGATISETEMVHMCILMLNGGHETTTNFIAGSVNALLDHPAQLVEMRDDNPGPIAIEELIRYVTPLQLQGRRTTEAVQIASGCIPADTEIVVCQGSANRDERKFDNPEALNLRRLPNTNIAFGVGIHACLGRFLAKMEAGIAVPAALKRFKRIERTGPAVFNRNIRFRGISKMPLLLQ